LYCTSGRRVRFEQKTDPISRQTVVKAWVWINGVIFILLFYPHRLHPCVTHHISTRNCM
jgi:hypothetical protein